MSRVMTKYCIAASLLLLPVGCARATFSDPVTFERLGRSAEPQADEVGIFSWRDGDHPANSRPALPPTFTCCESDFRITRAEVVRAANRSVTLPSGQLVGEITLHMRVQLRVRCARQRVDGEGGTGPAADCLLTFRDITVAEKPRFTRNPGGVLMEPTGQRIWWESATEKCNGRQHVATLNVVYVARFAHQGVPRVVSGEPPSQVAFSFAAKEGQGADLTVTIALEQQNLESEFKAVIRP